MLLFHIFLKKISLQIATCSVPRSNITPRQRSFATYSEFPDTPAAVNFKKKFVAYANPSSVRRQWSQLCFVNRRDRKARCMAYYKGQCDNDNRK